MATRSYTIRSTYEADEKEHELLVEEAEEREAQELAQLETTLRLPKPAPRFVPAKHADGERIVPKSSSVSTSTPQNLSSLEWYRSIRSSAASTPTPDEAEGPIAGPSKPRETVIAQPTPVSVVSSSSASRVANPRPTERKTKQNWFIMNAIESQPRTEPNTPAPNLAAMLARDPPPLPSEQKYKPPVWLEIGPSNRGFAMLQKSGWNEGEPLGPDVIRRPHSLPSPEIMSFGESSMKPRVKKEKREVQIGSSEDGVSEMRDVEVIDLTEEDDVGLSRNPTFIEEELPQDTPMDIGGPNERTALVTPIATRLKLDRLGIGLKAKTEGPHRASVKRVTHGQAALAAHMRAAAEQRKHIKQFGRGKRGFQRRYEKDALNRQSLLEQLR